MFRPKWQVIFRSFVTQALEGRGFLSVMYCCTQNNESIEDVHVHIMQGSTLDVMFQNLSRSCGKNVPRFFPDTFYFLVRKNDISNQRMQPTFQKMNFS